MTGRYFIATKLQQRVNQSVRSSFDRWCFNARFLRTDSSIVFRAMAAFAQRHLRAALNAWLEMIAQRRRIARALARWRRRECVAVLSALSFAVVCHRRKLRAARALLSRELHRAWNAWSVWLAGAREKRRCAHAALRTLTPTGRAKRKAFNSWNALAKEREVTSAAIGSMRNQPLLRALNAWHEFYEERLAARALGRKHANRWKLRSVAAAVRRMRQLGVQFRLMKRAARALRRREVARGTRSWKAVVAGKLAAEERVAAALRSFSPEGRAQRAALNTLKQWQEQRSHLRGAAASVVAYRLRRPWNSWAEEHAARSRARRALGQLQPEGRAKRRALNSWVEQAAECRRAQAALRSLQPHARAQRRALNTWLLFCIGRAEANQRLGFAARRWGSQATVAALRHLHALAEQRRLIRTAARAMLGRSLARGLRSWLAGARELAGQRQRLRATLDTFRPEVRAKRRAMNSWRGVMRQALLMHRAAGSLLLRRRRAAMNTWLTRLCDDAASHDHILDCRERWRRRGMTKARLLQRSIAWAHWRAQARWRQPARRTCLLLSHRTGRAWQRWRYWHRAAVVAKQRKRAMSEQRAGMQELVSENQRLKSVVMQLELAFKDTKRERASSISVAKAAAAAAAEKQRRLESAAREQDAELRAAADDRQKLLHEIALLRSEAEGMRIDVTAAREEAERVRHDAELKMTQVRLSATAIDDERRRLELEVQKAQRGGVEAKKRCKEQASELSSGFRAVKTTVCSHLFPANRRPSSPPCTRRLTG